MDQFPPFVTLRRPFSGNSAFASGPALACMTSHLPRLELVLGRWKSFAFIVRLPTHPVWLSGGSPSRPPNVYSTSKASFVLCHCTLYPASFSPQRQPWRQRSACCVSIKIVRGQRLSGAAPKKGSSARSSKHRSGSHCSRCKSGEVFQRAPDGRQVVTGNQSALALLRRGKV